MHKRFKYRIKKIQYNPLLKDSNFFCDALNCTCLFIVPKSMGGNKGDRNQYSFIGL